MKPKWTAETSSDGGVLIQKQRPNPTPAQAEKDRSLNFILTGDEKFSKPED